MAELSQSRQRHALTELALRACLVASDAAFNVKDFLTNSSRMALLAVRDCEKELDRIEQEIDEQLPAAITKVTEPEARELLACLRFSTDLERIGDLLWWVVQRAHSLQPRLPKTEAQQLVDMISILEKMLSQVRYGLEERALDAASYVLRADREINRIHGGLFRRHLEHHGHNILLMAQALERAGDHATNLAEEVFRLVKGRSLRHIPKKKAGD